MPIIYGVSSSGTWKGKAMILGLTTLVAWTVSTGATYAQPSCGDPPRVDDQRLKAEINGDVQVLSRRIGGAGLKSQLETARSDIFSKYPDADEARSNA